MKILTWNCCKGATVQKLALITPFRPSISILQECPRLDSQSQTTLWPGESRLWFGDNPRQGIAVIASPGYSISAVPACEVPRFTIPVQVTGPANFLLLAVWSKTDLNYRYVKAVHHAVDCYRDLITAQPTVIVGDFNSNKIWDYKRPSDVNHSGLVRKLVALGLVSAYHHFHSEEQGAETRPTLHLLKKRQKAYHIDYCFIPESWAPHIKSVEVGAYDTWSPFSDHCPMVVDIAVPGAVQPVVAADSLCSPLNSNVSQIVSS
jgi:hypothetical protein